MTGTVPHGHFFGESQMSTRTSALLVVMCLWAVLGVTAADRGRLAWLLTLWVPPSQV